MTVNNYLKIILFGITKFKEKEIDLTFEKNILKFQHIILKAELDFEKNNNVLKVNFIENHDVAIRYLESCITNSLNSRIASDKSPLYKMIFPEYSNKITDIEDYYKVLFNIPSLDGYRKIGELCANDIVFLLSVSKNIDNVKLPKNNESFTNKFDQLSEENVYNYFNDNLVVRGYIEISDLQNFLKNAFEFLRPLETKIIFKRNIKICKVRKIFYEYCKIAGQPYGEHDKYIRLLTDNFSNYDFKKIKNNFSK